MAQRCTVCQHPARVEIEKSLIDGQSNRRIATHAGLTESAIRRHRGGHMAQQIAETITSELLPTQTTQTTRQPTRPPRASTPGIDVMMHAASRRAQSAGDTLDILQRIREQLETRLDKLSDAVDVWLTDPEDPTRYAIDARAGEVTVIYEDWSGIDADAGERPRKMRGKLSELLEQLHRDSGGRIVPMSGETRIADPRKLLIDVVGETRAQLALVAQIVEKIHAAQSVEAFESAVLAAIDEVDPATKHRIIDNLRRRQPARRLD